MFWTNFHSHSTFCDGSGQPETHLQRAIEAEMVGYGFSSHAPLPFETSWAMKAEQLPFYLREINRLQSLWQSNIEVYAGLEIDFIPGLSWWDQVGPAFAELDYAIGSVHFVDQFPDGTPWQIDGDAQSFMSGLEQVFKGDVKAAVTRYYELVRWMVMLESPDIVGHLDKIKVHNAGGFFFAETDSWYRSEVDKTLRVISNMGSIVEVNTRGLYSGSSLDLYPSQWILERIQAMNIPITLSSDAHDPEEVVAGFEIAGRILWNLGFRTVSILKEGTWREVGIREPGRGLDVPCPGIQSTHNQLA